MSGEKRVIDLKSNDKKNEAYEKHTGCTQLDSTKKETISNLQSIRFGSVGRAKAKVKTI